MASATEQSLQKQTVKELQSQLRAAGLSPYGRKQELIERLLSAKRQTTPTVSPPRAGSPRAASPPRQPVLVRSASPVRTASPSRSASTTVQVQPQPEAQIIGITYTAFGIASNIQLTYRAAERLGSEIVGWSITQDLVDLDIMTPAHLAIKKELNALAYDRTLTDEAAEERERSLYEQEAELQRRGEAWMDLDYDYFRSQILPGRPSQIVIGGLYGLGPGDNQLMEVILRVQSLGSQPLNLLDVLLAVREYARYFYRIGEALGYSDWIYNRDRLWLGVTPMGVETSTHVPYYYVSLE